MTTDVIRQVKKWEPNVWGEQPRLANKIIDKNKINREPENNLIAQDRGVGSTDSLEKNRKSK